jgi:hypothetical protein
MEVSIDNLEGYVMEDQQDRITELEAQIASLSTKLEELATNFAPQPAASVVEAVPANGDEPTQEVGSTGSRRNLFKLAAGAAAGGTALAIAKSAGPVAADDPNDLTLGATKSTTGPTTGTKTGTGTGTSFLFRSGTDFSSSQSGFPSALGGWGMLSQQTVGVYGYSNQSGSKACGVVGVSTDPDTVGVRGLGPTAIEGIGSGVGVQGEGPAADFLASGSGKVLISKAGTPGPIATGTVGTIARDAAGALWYCYATDKWRELAGATSSGAFHAITPKRVYDSRPTEPPTVGPQTKLNPADPSRTIDCTANASGVPPTATAVVLNLTAANTTGLGNLRVYPDGAALPPTSSINYTPGVNIANSTTSGCGPGAKLAVKAGGNSGADFIIDILGYYV